MGQSQSSQQQKVVLQNRTPTPEPMDPEEAARIAEENERVAAEDRARRAAAAEKRFAAQKNVKGKRAVAAATDGEAVTKKKKETALEQLSRENKGWRDADAQADMRAYN